MIIFFNNKTGRIYGSVSGRVHTDEELNTTVIPSGVDRGEISKRVFDIDETKEIEKSGFKVMGKKVVLKNGEFSEFADADKIEPQRPSSVETIVIDISRPLEAIRADFSETTRRWIKRATDMTFRELGFNDRAISLDVLEEVEDFKDIRMAKHLFQIRSAFLDGLRKIYVVEDKNKNPLATALVTCFRTKEFVYTLGGVTLKGRDTHAGDYLLWELMKDAKDLGYETFDLGGIYADWASDEKKKVNKFKKRWGGNKVSMMNVRHKL